MIDLEFYFRGFETMQEIGEWLDKNMQNPPVPEPPRWTLGESNDGTGRSGIRFFNDEDATLFALRWSHANRPYER
jgi:hypothetical protein